MANNISGIGSESLVGNNEGSVEFDSAEGSSAETRLSAARALAEELNRSGESRFESDLMISGSKWRVLVEKL